MGSGRGVDGMWIGSGGVAGSRREGDSREIEAIGGEVVFGDTKEVSVNGSSSKRAAGGVSCIDSDFDGDGIE